MYQGNQEALNTLATQTMLASAVLEDQEDQRDDGSPRHVAEQTESEHHHQAIGRLHQQSSLPADLDPRKLLNNKHRGSPKTVRYSIVPLNRQTSLHRQDTTFGAGNNETSTATHQQQQQQPLPNNNTTTHRSSFGPRARFSSLNQPAKQPGRLSQDAALLNTNPIRIASLSDSDDDDDDMFTSTDSMDDLSWELGAKKPWYKKKWTARLLPLLLSCVFIVAGGLYLAYGGDEAINNIQIWRLCFFLAGLPAVWLIGDLVTKFTVWGVEHTMFTVQNALYFAYAVRKPLANVLRAALSLGWWALMMTAWGGDQDTTVERAYHIVLKIWACVTLCMLANLLKTLLAKILALKFNKQSHLKKIQDSLRKEYILHLLLQPRLRSAEEEDEEGDGGQGDGYNNNAHREFKRSNTTFTQRLMHIRASVRGIFAGKTEDEGTTTISEELLEEGSPQDPSNITIQVDCVGDHHRGGGGKSKSEQHTSSTTTTTKRPSTVHIIPSLKVVPIDSGQQQQALQRQSTLTSNAAAKKRASITTDGGVVQQGSRRWTGGHRGSSSDPHHQNNRHNSQLSRQNSMAPSLPNSQRTAAARLSTVLESPVVMRGKKKMNIDMRQLAKMEKYVRKNALKVTFRDELSRVETDGSDSSEAEAKKLAYYLFWNVKADLEREYLIPDDFRDFLPDSDIEEAFNMIDEDRNGSINLTECMTVMTKLFEERRDLAVSLKDTKSVVGKLESVIGVIIHIIFMFLYMLVFNIDVMKTYLALSSLILAFSFVFNNSIRTMYENVVFLFVVRPFTIGDTLQVDTETYKVEQIDLLYTIVQQSSGGKLWYPNQKLMATPFINLSVSGDKFDCIKILIDMDLPASIIDIVKEAVLQVQADMPSEMLAGSVGVNIRDAQPPLKYTLIVGFKYTHPGIESGRCSRVRTTLHLTLAEVLYKAGVRYSLPGAGAINGAAASDTTSGGVSSANAASKKAV